MANKVILLSPHLCWDKGFIFTLYGDRWQGNELACIWIEDGEMENLIELKKAKIIE
jgi:hypothetical protein